MLEFFAKQKHTSKFMCKLRCVYYLLTIYFNIVDKYIFKKLLCVGIDFKPNTKSIKK